MFRKETSTRVQESAQVFTSPVSPYQALQDADDAAPESEMDLSEDSVDFHSLLSHVSGDAHEESVARTSDSGAAQKNLNISSIITKIRDEGPAGSRLDERPLSGGRPEARRHHEGDASARKSESGSAAGESAKSLPPTAEEVTQLARAAAEELLAARFEAAKPEKVNRTRWLFPALFLCLLAAGGYVLYKLGSELALAKAGIVQLSTRLAKAEETMSGLRRQVSANASHIQAAYTPEKLQEEMAAYRQQMQEALDLRLDLMALSTVPVSSRGEGNDSPRNPSTAPQESKAPQSVSRSPSVQERPREEKAQRAPRGNWNVYLASYGTERHARKALEKYVHKVPEARVQPAWVRGKKVFRVTVPGFAGKKEASRYLAQIRMEPGLEGSWIGRGAAP